MTLSFHTARTGHAPLLRLGTTRDVFPFVRVPVALSEQDLASHVHIMGVTGQGKSKLLAHLATQLIVQGRACSVIDPHADLATDILAQLLDAGYFRRPDAMRRVWYVDFSNSDAFIPFNFLRSAGAPHTIAGSVLAAFHRAWPALGQGVAPTFDTLILNGVKVLLSNALPLPHLYRLLTDASYRNHLLAHEPDDNVVAVFHTWFDHLSPRDQADQAGAALRRANLLTFHPTLKYSLGQWENRLDFRRLMDTQVSVIFNLSGLDEQTQRLLGCLLSVGFETAALSREDTSEEQRLPYHLLVDEFSMFSAQSEESLARVLSLARKYQLFLVLAHQTWSQLSAKLHGALQNSTPLFFRLGFDDAMWAAPRLSEADPYSVKHEVKPLSRDLPMEYHPAYLSLSEQDRLMATRLERLAPQQALLKRTPPARAHGLLHFLHPARAHQTHVLQITTETVPPARSSREEVEALKARYAQELLTPLASLQARQQERADTASSSVSTVAEPAQGLATALSAPLRGPMHARLVPLASPPTSSSFPHASSGARPQEHTLFVRHAGTATAKRCARMTC